MYVLEPNLFLSKKSRKVLKFHILEVKGKLKFLVSAVLHSSCYWPTTANAASFPVSGLGIQLASIWGVVFPFEGYLATIYHLATGGAVAEWLTHSFATQAAPGSTPVMVLQGFHCYALLSPLTQCGL